jgi:hypothetical protein
MAGGNTVRLGYRCGGQTLEWTRELRSACSTKPLKISSPVPLVESANRMVSLSVAGGTRVCSDLFLYPIQYLVDERAIEFLIYLEEVIHALDDVGRLGGRGL